VNGAQILEVPLHLHGIKATGSPDLPLEPETEPPGAPFARRQAAVVPVPAAGATQALSRLLLICRLAATTRGTIRWLNTTPSGHQYLSTLAAVSRCQRPSLSVCALSRKMVMREHRQRVRAARRWQVLVGVRWQRLQCAVASRYYQRVTLPVQWWVACGRREQFRPQLPWWQPFVYRWLVITGWQRPRRRERSG
jgi:hypothetical protein